eukprot:352239-Chlamydomonas_euryale.AAC.19
MDDDMLKALATSGINTWPMDSDNTKGDMGWGSPDFHKMVGGLPRVRVVRLGGKRREGHGEVDSRRAIWARSMDAHCGHAVWQTVWAR